MYGRRSSHLRVRRVAINNIHMVVAHGDCDICSVQLLKDAMAEVIKEGHKKLIVDAKKLRYIDGSGIAAILWARHKIEENGGKLVIIGLNGKLSPTINMLSDVLSTATSVAEALLVLNNGKLQRR